MAPSSLSGSIVQSLKIREMSSRLLNDLLTHDRTRVLHKDESDYWDYKEVLRLDTPSEIARLAKDVLAFHNSKGGVLIVGVDDDYRVIGIPRSQILDTYQIKEKIQKYTGPNVMLFQNTIDVPNSRVLWLIFVPKREGMPVSVASNGPHDGTGRPEIRHGEYYMRLHDQSILCKEPSHLERVFAGASIAHLQAYRYDIDEPYFRLLAPYCDQFVGRHEEKRKVEEALRTRHPVVALDGPGGVGKTEIAIEVARKLQKSGDYLFVISQSAKTQVWDEGRATSRQADFAGLTEFLTEVAKVLQIAIPTDHEELKASVISAMAGYPGLLLVDNIEEARDYDLLRFLSKEVPDPVKVLVTSRIDKGLGPFTISIPEMNDADAQDLLAHELERQEYHGITEHAHVEALLSLTGKVPLALKWAAAIAASTGSLEEAVRRLGKIDAQKRQFLSFSFATMYDALTPLSRDAALLCPYIGEDWNAVSVAMILDKPEEEVETAIRELKDRGILMSSEEGQPGAYRILPLTREFLSIKFNENQKFHENVTRKIADLFVSPDGEKILLNLPPEQRVEILYQRAEELRAVGNFSRAEQMLKLASKWSPVEQFKVMFLRGRVIYESGAAGRLQEAIWNMSIVERESTRTDQDWAPNAMYYGRVLDSYGEFKDGLKILSLLKDSIPQASDVSVETMGIFSKYATDKDILDLSKKVHDSTTQYRLVKGLESKLGDTQFIFEAGRDLMFALRLAATSDQATPTEKLSYYETADRIGKQYKQIENLQTKSRAAESSVLKK